MTPEPCYPGCKPGRTEVPKPFLVDAHHNIDLAVKTQFPSFKQYGKYKLTGKYLHGIKTIYGVAWGSYGLFREVVFYTDPKDASFDSASL